MLVLERYAWLPAGLTKQPKLAGPLVLFQVLFLVVFTMCHLLFVLVYILFQILALFLFGFCDGVSLCFPGWPGIHDPPASASGALGL